MADINQSNWSETDASNNSSGTIPGFPEGMVPSVVNDNARGVMGGIKRWYNRSNATVTSTGSSNVQVLTYTIAPTAYVTGDVYRFIAGFTNSGAVTLNINALGAKPVITAGSALSGGEILASSIAVVAYDGTSFQLLNPTSVLTTNKTYYVSTTGNDANAGTIGSPWATLQHAYTIITTATTFGSHTVTVLMTPGTYNITGSALIATYGNWIIGSSTNVATDVVVAVTSGDGFNATGTANVTIQHLTVGSVAGGSYSGYACTASGSASMTLNNVNLNASGVHVVAFDGGNINIAGNYVINGGAVAHYFSDHGTLTASAAGVPITVSSSVSVAFSSAFAFAQDAGFLRAISANYAGVTATGVRYVASSNGVIQTNGASATYFPGNAPGTTGTGGLYV